MATKETGECAVYGFANVEFYSTTARTNFKPNSTGWAWLAKSDLVHVQGKVNEAKVRKTHVFLVDEITVGGPILLGGVVYFTTDTVTWWPPTNGSAETKVAFEDVAQLSLPGGLSVSSLGQGERMREGLSAEPVIAVRMSFGDYAADVHTVEMPSSSALAGQRFFDLNATKPMDSSETGVCVNGEVLPVSESENFVKHHSPAPGGILPTPSTVATAKALPDSGTADTFAYVALSLGFANSIVPFFL
jgi:hypothetical protein